MRLTKWFSILAMTATLVLYNNCAASSGDSARGGQSLNSELDENADLGTEDTSEPIIVTDIIEMIGNGQLGNVRTSDGQRGFYIFPSNRICEHAEGMLFYPGRILSLDERELVDQISPELIDETCPAILSQSPDPVAVGSDIGLGLCNANGICVPGMYRVDHPTSPFTIDIDASGDFCIFLNANIQTEDVPAPHNLNYEAYITLVGNRAPAPKLITWDVVNFPNGDCD